MELTNIKKGINLILIVIIISFGLVFSSISLVNHYNFRTYAWDLGINNNAIYDYAHFRWNDCMIMQPQFKNILADHFSLLPLLVSPLYWLFGSYTMLIFQIVAILLGGVGIFKYFKARSSNFNLSVIAMIHFYSIWGIYSALGFDYHDNVIAAMLVPWLFYTFENRKWKWAVFFFILICISKENMALWAIFIGLTLFLLNRKTSDLRLKSLYLSAFALFYFILVVKVIIPALSNDGREYLHFHYKALGENFGEAIKTILTKPQYVFSLIFENNTGWNEANYIKSELHFFVLLSGGYALFYKPQFIPMVIPIYAQKLFNDDIGKWGLNYQYSIEFVPILTLALYSLLQERNQKNSIIIYLLPCIITIAATISSLDHRVSKWYNPEQLRFYQKEHYKTPYNVKDVQEVLNQIPSNAIVSATNGLVPHMAFRDFIYQFPVVNDAEYIVLLKSSNTYPLSQSEFDEKLNELNQSNDWEKLIDKNYMLVYKHNKPK
ncbi:MAG: DUF2079 domain-containing protein [Bacteroidetes bacterium]|jgi:uncharacterized membrane protein|nr:DUF2079 domain-containing protein [Bacteroidota bacterium]